MEAKYIRKTNDSFSYSNAEYELLVQTRGVLILFMG